MLLDHGNPSSSWKFLAPPGSPAGTRRLPYTALPDADAQLAPGPGQSFGTFLERTPQQLLYPTFQ